MHMPLHRIEQPWPDVNDGYTYEDKIRGRQYAGMSLLQYYSERYSFSGSKEEWLSRFADKQITVNGQDGQPSYILRAGDVLSYNRPPWHEPDSPCYIDIIYEDEHLMVVQKPSGLQVLPGAVFQQRTVLSLLAAHRSCPHLPGNQPAPVHRLGRGTSGVLLCACTAEAARQLSKDFSVTSEVGTAAKPVRKKYRALVEGIPQQTEVEIFTGRPHQIRIHMAYIGHPLVGDPLYGPGGIPKVDAVEGGGFQDAQVPMPGDCGYTLHNQELCFWHPVSGAAMTMSARPPEQLRLPDELPPGGCYTAAAPA